MKIARLSSCKNFVSEREKFIFDAFVAFCHTAGKKGGLRPRGVLSGVLTSYPNRHIVFGVSQRGFFCLD